MISTEKSAAQFYHDRRWRNAWNLIAIFRESMPISKLKAKYVNRKPCIYWFHSIFSANYRKCVQIIRQEKYPVKSNHLNHLKCCMQINNDSMRFVIVILILWAGWMMNITFFYKEMFMLFADSQFVLNLYGNQYEINNLYNALGVKN